MSSVNVTVKDLKIDITQEIDKVLKKKANDLAKTIEANSPGGGDYASGWTSKKTSPEEYTIYNDGNKKTLTHLLELGHRTRPSGKTKPKVGKKNFVPPQQHILPSYNQVKPQLLEELTKIKIESK